MAGNFNMTNAAELFSQLVGYGLNPTGDSDTSVILEKVGYFLDEEHRTIEESTAEELNGRTGLERSRAISSQLDIVRAFSLAAAQFDGGYVLAGMMGNGDSFIARDPNGIRPAYFLQTDEFIAAASERPPLANVFDVDIDDVQPINPGHILAIKRDGSVRHEPFIKEATPSHCTFERIYFSRGNDPAIYEERKQLGRSLAPRVLDLIDHDVDHTVFSFIPNTAESAYLGMVEEVDHLMLRCRADRIWAAVEAGDITHEKLIELAGSHIRAERLAHKDQRLRTFITHDAARRDLVEHIYDITRGVVNNDDNLVVIDDSIVRGTTLRESILTSLSRLNPKRIIVVSSAPPIIYPDCYGIDMSQLSRFIAFEAAVALLEDRGESSLLDEVEAKCLEQATLAPEKMVNQVGAIYDRFSLEELETKIGELLRPKHIPWEGQLDIIYQSVEGLQSAMPKTTGDWYFTGNYPTPGGYAVLNTSYLNWRQGQSSARAY
jgi:amidophosphoribosyltransferase